MPSATFVATFCTARGTAFPGGTAFVIPGAGCGSCIDFAGALLASFDAPAAAVFFAAAAEAFGSGTLATGLPTAGSRRIARTGDVGFVCADAFAGGLASFRCPALAGGFFTTFALLFFTLAVCILAGAARRRDAGVREEPLLGTQSPFLNQVTATRVGAPELRKEQTFPRPGIG